MIRARLALLLVLAPQVSCKSMAWMNFFLADTDTSTGRNVLQSCHVKGTPQVLCPYSGEVMQCKLRGEPSSTLIGRSLLYSSIKSSNLACCWRWFSPAGLVASFWASVHSFMSSVLLRVSGLIRSIPIPEANRPHGESAKTKTVSLVKQMALRYQSLWQAVVHLLKTRSNVVIRTFLALTQGSHKPKEIK